jgi:Predicted glutamine amidotransferase
MCELFAVSSAHPARVRLRFAEFATHGAPVQGGNPDGWGAAYFDGLEAHLLREPKPAVRSAFARVLEEHDFHSPLVLAHVRRASRGPVALANTQPFTRELAGHRHVFAHNGDLPDIQLRWPLDLGGAQAACWQPVGQTDSEHVFCQLLRELAPLWRTSAGVPDVDLRLAVVAAFAARLRPIGPANFLYADGDVLFAHSHRRISWTAAFAHRGCTCFAAVRQASIGTRHWACRCKASTTKPTLWPCWPACPWAKAIGRPWTKARLWPCAPANSLPARRAFRPERCPLT